MDPKQTESRVVPSFRWVGSLCMLRCLLLPEKWQHLVQYFLSNARFPVLTLPNHLPPRPLHLDRASTTSWHKIFFAKKALLQILINVSLIRRQLNEKREAEMSPAIVVVVLLVFFFLLLFVCLFPPPPKKADATIRELTVQELTLTKNQFQFNFASVEAVVLQRQLIFSDTNRVILSQSRPPLLSQLSVKRLYCNAEPLKRWKHCTVGVSFCPVSTAQPGL